MTPFPCWVRSVSTSGAVRYRLGDPRVDRYLEFVAGRARPNTLRAVAFDLKTFYTVVSRDPREVAPADVFESWPRHRTPTPTTTGGRSCEPTTPTPDRRVGRRCDRRA